MVPNGAREQPFRVVIAGASVAGLETAFALRELAGDAVETTLLAPTREFVYRPMTVAEPFGYRAARRYALAQIAHDLDAELLEDGLAWVDSQARRAHTHEHGELSYDALVLALGARARARYEHALTIDDRRMDETLHGLIQDIEGQYIRTLALVIPSRIGWPLPMYELALMISARVYDLGLETSLSILTPEDAPLAIFGPGVSGPVAQLLQNAGVNVIGSCLAEVPGSGEVVMSPGERTLHFDRVVALPELFGPSVRGLPAAENGFIPVDLHGRVQGVERVYAAGDATSFAVKHGGIAAQQGDAVAQAVADLAGVRIEPEPFDPVIRGILLTGGAPKYLCAHLTGGHGFSSQISDVASWSPATKIAARYLAPYLEARDREAAQGAPAP